MTQAQDWLPDDCLTGAALAEPFKAIIAAWSAQWFATARWVVSGNWTAMPNDADMTAAGVAQGAGITVHCTDKGRRSVAAAMIGLPVDKAVPRHADAKLVDGIAEKALADLNDRLALVVCPETGATSATRGYLPPSRAFHLPICNAADEPCLTLQAASALLIELARTSAPAPRIFPAVANRQNALADMAVSVGTKIGAIHLPLSDLKELGVGDVIAFNRPVDSALDLTVDGTVAALSALKLRSDDRQLYLELTRSLV